VYTFDFNDFDKLEKLMKDKVYLDDIMKEGKEKAITIAEPVLSQVYEIVGLAKT
jgi:hypothetical protein